MMSRERPYKFKCIDIYQVCVQTFCNITITRQLLPPKSYQLPAENRHYSVWRIDYYILRMSLSQGFGN